ncbi:MAG TPA: VCBS repeat-containing protein [Gemmatimonadaceae bacterium]|nr:VCBS repeat-containing protein [Gemmatimonadaceae bacterium]
MRKKYVAGSVAATVVTLLTLSCHGESAGPRLFRILSASETGIDFANTIAITDSLNVRTDPYVYNGAGVGVGDIDNDGLPDIFFAGNTVSSRLYLNKGNFHFEDITRSAGVKTTRWATGVSTVDINNDGYLDFYVSVSGPPWSRAADRANLLFVNNHNRTFTEEAAQYGIADTGFTTHAAFLDYDGDGCIDLFVLNNSPRDFSRGDLTTSPSGARGETPGSYNELYRNDCHGKFIDVSAKAGILHDPGYGLGVAVADLNRDGWPDIYVSNDITPNDVLYVNNGNGTFTNKAATWLKHTSFAGMGVDIADYNDDGWPDILQVDMLPRDLAQRKEMSGYVTYSARLDAERRGFRPDFTANALQLSNGVTPAGDVIFSDVSHLAGVAATDWSWSPLFADFDNDGYKDIFISNGYPKAVIDFDYQAAMAAARRGRDSAAAAKAQKEIFDRLYPYNPSNYFFRNEGDLTFRDETEAWGVEGPSFSYGAAYADLDKDGRLDLVVNNIDAPALIYRNVAPRDDQHHHLELRLDGAPPNRLNGGIGASLTLTAGGRTQYAYHSPYRGYMSSMDDRLYFGLGSARRVDSLEIRWPDGRRQLLTNLPVDTLLVLRQIDAAKTAPVPPSFRTADRWFEPVVLKSALSDSQKVSGRLDYGVQPLLPYLISSQGPAIAVADVNGDHLDDIYIAGGGGIAGELLLQKKDGSFTAPLQGEPWAADKDYEDWGATFFDANGDGLPDLYVASGGYQLSASSPLLQDRLYINKGGGHFARDSAALPTMLTSTAAVRAGDFTGDGKPDLFVGGRLTPRSYPYPTRSYLLRNDGGHFTDVTNQVAPELVSPGGMITDAVWVDFDGDGKLDLVTVGEWMPIQFYHNDGKQLHNVTAASHLPPMRGWWYSLAVGDFDRDGRPDIVAGNLGLNYDYTTSPEAPFGIYAGDFTGNRSTDIILSKKVGGTEYPLAGLVPLGRDIYTLGIKFPTYGSFAQASIPQILTPAQLQHAIHYQADTFASVFLHNAGGGSFTVSNLPNLAQIAPIKGIVVDDVDGDGNLDLIVAGNLYDAEPNTPRADAGNGLWLKGDGKGHFTPVAPYRSGFLAPGNVSGLTLVKTARGNIVIVANSGGSLQAFGVGRR